MSSGVREAIEQRVALETRLQSEPAELSGESLRRYDAEYARLQRDLARLFRTSGDERDRITAMLEMIRILENRLVYLQNFTVDATSDNRLFAQLVTRFLDDVVRERSRVLTPLEATYYRAVAALYAGDVAAARDGFSAACASEESDEANDIKYKSYVILGNLSHEDADYARARELHEQSLRYSANENVTAQALALKALNSYALQEHDEALHLFEESLRLFDPNRPFFNSYFYRNALLFCGAICYDRGDHDRAEEHYRRAADEVETNSYDRFDALSHLGRIAYARDRWEEAAAFFEQALEAQRFSENEAVIDTWFRLARTHMQRGDAAAARQYLEKIVASESAYGRRSQVMEMLEEARRGGG